MQQKDNKMTAKELFKKVFPGEKIEKEISGFFNSRFVKKNALFDLNFSRSFNLSFFVRKGEVIVGSEHILIDLRRPTLQNIEYLTKFLIPAGLIIFLVYTLISKSLLFVIFSMFVFWPIPIVLFLSKKTGVSGGRTSYVINKQWIARMETDPNFKIEGEIPGGKPYTLSQYLAMNDIEIKGFLSGKSAWLGSEYPWPFVESNFHISVLSDTPRRRKFYIIVLIFSIVLLWLLFHGIYKAVISFNKLSF